MSTNSCLPWTRFAVGCLTAQPPSATQHHAPASSDQRASARCVVRRHHRLRRDSIQGHGVDASAPRRTAAAPSPYPLVAWPPMRIRQKYRMRTPSTGREVVIEAEPGQVYVDRETGEELEVVAELLPLAPTAFRASVGGREPALLQLVRPALPEGPQRLPAFAAGAWIRSAPECAPSHASARFARRPARGAGAVAGPGGLRRRVVDRGRHRRTPRRSRCRRHGDGALDASRHHADQHDEHDLHHELDQLVVGVERLAASSASATPSAPGDLDGPAAPSTRRRRYRRAGTGGTGGRAAPAAARPAVGPNSGGAGLGSAFCQQNPGAC